MKLQEKIEQESCERLRGQQLRGSGTEFYV